MLSPKCQRLLYLKRQITTTSFLLAVNHYQILGLTKGATQKEIKEAYYKMSMLYHPDKNKNSETAIEKFRKVTQAYEVLGNFRLRKLYDKGIIHTAGPEYAQAQREADEVEVKEQEDDPQTRFYKARMKRSNVPDASGKTTIYDFDEWSRSHYGNLHSSHQQTVNRVRNQDEKEKIQREEFQTEVVLFAGIVALSLWLFVGISETSNDIDRKNQNEKKS